MLTSLAYIFLVGLATAAICQKIKLPRIIGMLFTGVILGPFVLDLLDPSILGISSELRKLALIIILIKAGLSLNPEDLKKVGRPALLLSFLPASFEIAAITLLAPLFLGLTHIEAALAGAVLAAVSPAVVVPRMVALVEEKRGTEKSIPQMILAGASLDDVYVIVVFSTVSGMVQGGSVNYFSMFNIPVSIVLGVVLGMISGWLLARYFEWKHDRGESIRNSIKVVIVLGVSFLLVAVEKKLEGRIAVSGLLAVMSMACMLQRKARTSVSQNLADKFGKLWIAAEVILFVLVGAAVDIRYTLGAGGKAILVILLALVVRGIGVWVCLLGTELNLRERCFCIISYLPKATVQAAIGSVPLSLGFSCGKTILSMAVLAILITAPLGAIGIDRTGKRFLEKES